MLRCTSAVGLSQCALHRNQPLGSALPDEGWDPEDTPFRLKRPRHSLPVSGFRTDRKTMANRYYHGPRSDHFDGHRFFHPGLPASDKTILDLLRWKILG